MSPPPRRWPSLPFLDAMRPGPDESVDLALLAAYSADLPSIAASLLALAGRDDDDGDGTRHDLADAIEQLRGRVRIVIQRGRLAAMRQTPRLVGIFDQFVREVGFDEREGSWHPKAALVRYAGPAGPHWRLWIGSRNLTASENRDIGLLLCASAKGGRPIEGAGEVARALAREAGLPDTQPERLAAQIGALRWRAPKGIKVERLTITDGEGRATLPALPPNIEALTVVSPFLDAGFLRHVRKAEAPGRYVLLSTRHEVERLAGSAKLFSEVLSLDAPAYAAAAPGEGDAEPAEAEITGQGLHAKLLHVRARGRRRLWLGSANATCRAWTGRNVEVTAELAIDETQEAGLLALLDEARPVAPEEIADLEDSAEARDLLECARSEVAARWDAQIEWDEAGLRLVTRKDPHPSDERIELEAGLVTGDLLPWPRSQRTLDFGTVEKDARTEFIQLRLSFDGRQHVWIQRAEAEPPFGIDRDRAAFVRHLGVRGFLTWIAGQLADSQVIDDGGSWADETHKGERSEPAGTDWRLDQMLPTLEEMLSCWARNREAFDRIDRRVRDYLPPVLEQAAVSDPEGARQLREFASLWSTVRSGLGVR